MLELMACCALSEPLLRELTLPSSARDDKLFGIWYSTLKQYYESWESLPSISYLRAAITTELQALPFDVQTSMTLEAQVVLKFMEDHAKKPPEEIDKVGRHWLRLWMTQALAAEAVRKLSDNPQSARDIFDQASRQVSVIDGVEAGRFTEVFPDNSLGEEQLVYERTGLDFIDVFCGGGLIAGEVVGHLAPSGQGKTTLVLQLAWSRIERALSQYSHLPLDDIPWEKIPKVYVFAYEIVVNLVMNLMSNAAQIPRNTAKSVYITKDLSRLSTSAKHEYHDYEKRQYGDLLELAARGKAPWPPGELERFQRIARISNQLLQIADFSGANSALTDWAVAGVPGIKNYIQSHQDQVGRPGVDMVFVDYVGAMVDAMSNMRKDEESSAIRQAPKQLGRQVAAVFNCPAWAAHQLDTTQNRKQGGSVPQAKDADRCKLFHEQCAICMASGMLTKEGAAVWVLAKNRRDMPVNIQVARLDGPFARWVSANKEFSVVQGMVVSTKEVNSKPVGRVPGGAIAPSFGNKSITGLEE